MKTIRQMTVIFLAAVLALSLAACGSAEKTVVLQGDMTEETGGIPTTDTWTLTAKGDIIQKITEVYEMDFSDYDEEMIAMATSMFDSLIMEPAQGIEGVECTSAMNGSTYVITMTIDCTGDALKQAAEAELLTVDGNTDAISLKQTQESLEGQGYKVIE